MFRGSNNIMGHFSILCQKLQIVQNNILQYNRIEGMKQWQTKQSLACEMVKFLEKMAYSETKIDECKRTFQSFCLQCFKAMVQENADEKEKTSTLAKQYPSVNVEQLLDICFGNQNFFHSYRFKQRYQFSEIIRKYFDIPEGNDHLKVDLLYNWLKPRYKKHLYIKDCNHEADCQKRAQSFSNLLNTIIVEHRSIQRQMRNEQPKFEQFLQENYLNFYNKEKKPMDFISHLSFQVIRQVMDDTNTYNRLTYNKICNFLSDMKFIIKERQGGQICGRKAFQKWGRVKCSRSCLKRCDERGEKESGTQRESRKEQIQKIMSTINKYEQILAGKRIRKSQAEEKGNCSALSELTNRMIETVDHGQNNIFKVHFQKQRKGNEEGHIDRQKGLQTIQSFQPQQKLSYFQYFQGYLDRIENIKQRALHKYFLMHNRISYTNYQMHLSSLIHLHEPTLSFQRKQSIFGSIKTQIF